MHIRPAEPADLAEVGRLTLDAYVADGLLTPDDPYAAVLADADARHREAEVWVAEEDGRLLGTVTYVRPGTAYAEIAEPGEATMRHLAVAGDARGRGVGEALARHAISRAVEEGYAVFVLSSSTRMAAAHRMYERLGFTRVPERDWTPQPGVRLLVFRRDLP